ncbi:ribonuclease H-like domain-containing protein, partial [Tanacetum coccineum]
MVRSMWLFKHKFHADGTLNRYKARLVANGSSQQLGVDFDETFSPVVKPAIIRTVLSLAVSRQWPIHQLNVKNAFLNGDLSETVYTHQPPGFVDSRYPYHVCLLQRSFYGLKQAPRAWFERFAGYATRASFYHNRCDSSLFIYRQGSQVAYLLIYVDDIILTASSPDLLQQIITSLHNEFDITDLGALNYFLGISVDRTSTGLFLSQKKYALQLLERAHMFSRFSFICMIARAALCCPQTYLAICSGDCGFWSLVVRFRTTSLVGYTDVDWAGCSSTRRSTSGYCVFLGDSILSWLAKRQHTLSRFSAEAEYCGVANVVAEIAWLRNLLRELHSPLSTATLVYCDNVNAVYMSANPVQHQRMKHIEIDIHFVCDMVTTGQGARPNRRLRPNAFEAKAEWWVRSREFFDGRIHEAPTIPTPVKLPSRYDVPKYVDRRYNECINSIKELQKKNDAHEKMLREVYKFYQGQSKPKPVEVREHYRLSDFDFSVLQNTEGLRQDGPKTFTKQTSSSFFDMAQRTPTYPKTFEEPIPSRHPTSYPGTPHIATPMALQGFASWSSTNQARPSQNPGTPHIATPMAQQ